MKRGGRIRAGAAAHGGTISPGGIRHNVRQKQNKASNNSRANNSAGTRSNKADTMRPAYLQQQSKQQRRRSAAAKRHQLPAPADRISGGDLPAVKRDRIRQEIRGQRRQPQGGGKAESLSGSCPEILEKNIKKFCKLFFDSPGGSKFLRAQGPRVLPA